jgi:predicted nucleic acid-binding protein
LIALDTNILVYAESLDDPHGRYDKALNILSAVSRVENCLPLQVISEFLNVCRRKKRLEMSAAIERARSYADIFEATETSFLDLEQAATLLQTFNLQFFDALIVAVARRAGATLLLSEDMHDGLEIDDLRIVNPFVDANDTLLADYFGNAV